VAMWPNPCHKVVKEVVNLTIPDAIDHSYVIVL